MSLTRTEARNKIYSGTKRGKASPNNYKADVSGTCLDRCDYYFDEGYLAGNRFFWGYLDDRAVSPESLERAHNDLCYLADEITPEMFAPPTNEMITIGFADGVDQPTRDYLTEHRKFDDDGNSRYVFVIDSSAKAVLYNEYPKYRFRWNAKIQKKIGQDLQNFID